ncbi:preprotein translocase subunit YajC [Exiguobacterium flavidum]|uniref:preprotein translocase subunit YajC n=1 Tax=Exiguobacterium flavidum TaxID=2184695 RepID=UPI000DF7F2E2|nr:preprotein translocase subunit YajC [Exiguobacterium flavidum]
MEQLYTLLPMILIFVVFYFLLIRPQNKRQKQVREMQSQLSRGDSIVTIGGLHGTVQKVDDTTVTLKSGNAQLTFNRSAVAEVVKKSTTVTTDDEIVE